MTETIDFQLNGKPVRLTVDGERQLLWVLRTDLALTGPSMVAEERSAGPAQSWSIKKQSGPARFP